MSDLDPFGRKKDEDPLASLGWRGADAEGEAEGEPSAAEPAADLAPDRGRTPSPPRRPSRRERPRPDATGSWIGRSVRAFVVVGVLGVFAASVLGSLFISGADDEVGPAVDAFTAPDVPPSPASEVPAGREQPTLRPPPAPRARAAVPPRGVGRGSLLRPFAFGAAIARLRTGGYGRLTNLRVAPERIDATLLTKAGALRHVQIVPGGELRQFGPATTGFSGVPTMSLAGIDAGAPQRLTRSAAERLGLAPSRVNYLVYTQFAGTAQWNVYFQGGQIFSADTRGRITRRIS